MGVFIGYSSKSKAYKVYVVSADKVVVARNVKMIENASWNWKNTSATYPKQVQYYEQEKDEDSDDQPARGTRSLAEIYSRCNMADVEPVEVEEALKSQVWIAAMQEELAMIEKKGLGAC